MGRKEFIEEIEMLIESDETIFSEKAKEFFLKWKEEKPKGAKPITENGIKILKYMQQHETHKGSLFKASDIGEGLFMSGRSVAGCMRKLITDGFVEKEGKDPIVYSLTEKGESFKESEN